MTDVSVVIPTFERADLLVRTLESITRATPRGVDVEVVVVDDGSSDRSLLRAREVMPSGLRTFWHHDLGHRTAAARNVGLRAAESPVMWFVDCGVAVQPGALERHLAALDSGADVSIGGLRNNPGGGEGSAAGDEDPRAAELGGACRPLRAEDLPWRFAWTANLVIRTDAASSAGGFDERFTGWGAEDVEFAYRLHETGLRFTWSPEAEAVESDHPRAAANIRENVRNLGLMHELHPTPIVEVFQVARKLQQDVVTSVADAARYVTSAALRSPAPREVDLAAVLGRTAAIGLRRRADEDVSIRPIDHATDDDPSVWPSLGLRTRLPDGCFSAIRLDGSLIPIWSRWGAELLAEAVRIGTSVEIDEVLR